MVEITRQIQATYQKYGLVKADLRRLYVNSGRDQSLQLSDGNEIRDDVVRKLIKELVDRKVDVLIIDPFVSSHSASENV